MSSEEAIGQILAELQRMAAAIDRIERRQTRRRSGRRRTPGQVMRPLTDKQKETIVAVSRNGGSFAAAARELGKAVATVRESHGVAAKKLAALKIRFSGRSVHASALPTDERGQMVS